MFQSCSNLFRSCSNHFPIITMCQSFITRFSKHHLGQIWMISRTDRRPSPLPWLPSRDTYRSIWQYWGLPWPWRDPHSWMVSNAKSYLKWMIWGTPISGNLHVYSSDEKDDWTKKSKALTKKIKDLSKRNEDIVNKKVKKKNEYSEWWR